LGESLLVDLILDKGEESIEEEEKEKKRTKSPKKPKGEKKLKT